MVKKRMLTDGELRKFAHVVKEFTDVIQENNDDYAFYRGMVYTDVTGDVICVDFSVTDIDAREYTHTMYYNVVTNAISYSKRMSMNNDSKVIAALVKLVSRLERFDPPISKLRFDISAGYEYGFIDPSVEDEGCAVVTIFGMRPRDVQGRVYGFKLSKGGELTDGWGKWDLSGHDGYEEMKNRKHM